MALMRYVGDWSDLTLEVWRGLKLVQLHQVPYYIAVGCPVDDKPNRGG